MRKAKYRITYSQSCGKDWWTLERRGILAWEYLGCSTQRSELIESLDRYILYTTVYYDHEGIALHK
jgi:hypothetical protein